MQPIQRFSPPWYTNQLIQLYVFISLDYNTTPLQLAVNQSQASESGTNEMAKQPVGRYLRLEKLGFLDRRNIVTRW